jgi:uncharacterized protein YndB with AHSA1/START domain
MTNIFNKDFFIRKIYINKSIDKVYNLAATAGGLSKWFIDKAEFFNNGSLRNDHEFSAPGDKYKIYWLYKDYSSGGEVIKVQKNKVFKFTFGDAGIVTISLSEENGKTLVELKQENYTGKEYDHDSYVNCYVCWTFYLANLKSVLEKNYDMRDRENYMEGFVNK